MLQPAAVPGYCKEASHIQPETLESSRFVHRSFSQESVNGGWPKSCTTTTAPHSPLHIILQGPGCGRPAAKKTRQTCALILWVGVEGDRKLVYKKWCRILATHCLVSLDTTIQKNRIPITIRSSLQVGLASSTLHNRHLTWSSHFLLKGVL